MELPGVIYRADWDSSRVRSGLALDQRMIEAHIKKVQGITGSVALGNTLGFATAGLGQLDRFNTRLERTVGLGGRLNQSLDRMSNTFTTGLGIGATLGGLMLLERAFSRSIEKARQFQTAHLAIAATLQSSYKVVGANGQEIGGYQGFQVAKAYGEKFNQEIIRRQARNILVYQEQLGAFQSSVAAGARKGLTPEQVLDLSEQGAVVAKTLGLRGEQIANASRLLMGGGVNVGRSTIGRALGISNQDIARRSGDEFSEYLQSKMKGFKAAEPDFAKSIEGILSTLEAKFDVFFAKVGTKFMAKVSPAIEEFSQAFEGPKAEEFADTLADLFKQIFDSLKMIIDSGALGLIARFLEFLSKWGKDLVIGMVIAKLVVSIGTLGMGLANTVKWLREVSAEAVRTALALNTTGQAAQSAGAATSGAGAAGVAGVAARGARAAGAAGMPPLTAAMQAAAVQNLQMTMGMGGRYWQTPGTGGVSNLKQYAAKYNAALAAEQQAMQASHAGMSASGAYIGPGYTPPVVPSAREMMNKIRADSGLFSKQGLQYAKGTTIGALPRIGMGVMGGALAGQFIQSQTNQMESPVAQSAGNAMATALPLAAGAAMIPGVGLPVAGAILAVVTALKMFNDVLVNTRKKIEEATDAEKEQYKRIKGKTAVPFSEDAESAAAIAPFDDAIKTAEKDLADMKKRQQNKIMEKATGNKFSRFFGIGTKEIKFGDVFNDSMLPQLGGDVEKAQQNLSQLEKLKKARLETISQENMAEDLKARKWVFPGEESISVGKDKSNLFPTLGFGTAYRRDADARYEESLVDTLASAQKELADSGMSAEDIPAALMKIRDRFDKDYNLPLKKLQARLEGLGLGDKSENAAQMAELAYQITEKKIDDLVEVYGGLIDAAGLKSQARAERDVSTMLAGDTERQRAMFGDTPYDRRMTEGRLELYGRQIGRANTMNDALGNRYSAQLGGIYADVASQAGKGTFSSIAEARMYQQAKLQAFQPQMQLDYLGAGRQYNELTRQRDDLRREHPWAQEERKFGIQAAGFNLEKAQLAQSMYAGNTGPQFQDAASAIRWKVDAEAAMKKGFDPEQYEKDYSRIKEIEQAEMESAIRLAEINKQRVEAGDNLLRAENDYQTTLKELTIKIAEASKTYGTLTSDYNNVSKALSNQLQTGSKQPAARVASGVGKAQGGAQGGVTVTNNVDVVIKNEGGKMGMNETEIAQLAAKVKTKIEQECQRANARR